MFLGMLTRKFGSSILIGGDVGQDSRNSTRYVIYVRKSSEKICDLQILKQNYSIKAVLGKMNILQIFLIIGGSTKYRSFASNVYHQ